MDAYGEGKSGKRGGDDSPRGTLDSILLENTSSDEPVRQDDHRCGRNASRVTACGDTTEQVSKSVYSKSE
ncbi:hypothetical protein GCM10009585_05490 [Brevibacterium paucivorans]